MVGARDKIDALDCLRVDMGEFELDQSLSGYLRLWISTLGDCNESRMLRYGIEKEIFYRCVFPDRSRRGVRSNAGSNA